MSAWLTEEERLTFMAELEAKGEILDRETQQQVVGRMCRNLQPGGTLFIAHAETLQGLPLPLRNAGLSIYCHEPIAGTRP